jgi:hypothetical protein
MPKDATKTIKPIDGGELMPRFTEEAIGIANYITKRNWRRDYLSEIRTEGDVFFRPTLGERVDDAFPNFPNKDKAINCIHSAKAPNGEVALLVATCSTIYRYYALADGDYVWQFNGGIPDTPSFAFEILDYVNDKTIKVNVPTDDFVVDGDPFNYQNYFEAGNKVKVGYSSESNGEYTVVSWDYLTQILVVEEDIPESIIDKGYLDAYIWESDQGTWININPTDYEFSCDGHKWECETVKGETMFNNGMDLPVIYNNFEYKAEFAYELRERGIARVETIGKFKDMFLVGDITEIHPDAFLGWMNGETPYGLYDGQEQRRQYRLLSGPIASPHLWGAINFATINASDNTMILRFPMKSLSNGDEVIIKSAGSCEANLTTTITKVLDDKTFLLADFAETSVVDSEMINRANMTSGPMPYFIDLLDNSSAIRRILAMDKERLYIYKDRGIIVALGTDNPASPLQVASAYDGNPEDGNDKNLHYPCSLQRIDSDAGPYHLYAGKDTFYKYDNSLGTPKEHVSLAKCKNIFFDNVNAENHDSVISGINPITQQYWLSWASGIKTKILAYSYRWDVCEEMSHEYTSFGAVYRQSEGRQFGRSETWFLCGKPDGSVMLYGRTNEKEAIFNNEKAIYYMGGKTADTLFDYNGDYVTASLDDFFDLDDVGGFLFINDDFYTIIEFLTEKHVRIAETPDNFTGMKGGTFQSLLDNEIRDGLDGFSPVQRTGGSVGEEDEVEMKQIIINMSSGDKGAPVEFELFAAKNPNDVELGTVKSLFTRTIDNPRRNLIPCWYRNNYFQTRMSVIDSIKFAAWSTKVFKVRRLGGSDGIIRSRPAGGSDGDES